jgi:hypothetical protein
MVSHIFAIKSLKPACGLTNSDASAFKTESPNATIGKIMAQI